MILSFIGGSLLGVFLTCNTEPVSATYPSFKQLSISHFQYELEPNGQPNVEVVVENKGSAPEVFKIDVTISKAVSSNLDAYEYRKKGEVASDWIPELLPGERRDLTLPFKKQLKDGDYMATVEVEYEEIHESQQFDFYIDPDKVEHATLKQKQTDGFEASSILSWRTGGTIIFAIAVLIGYVFVITRRSKRNPR